MCKQHTQFISRTDLSGSCQCHAELLLISVLYHLLTIYTGSTSFSTDPIIFFCVPQLYEYISGVHHLGEIIAYVTCFVCFFYMY